jgi:hypothetical protein
MKYLNVLKNWFKEGACLFIAIILLFLTSILDNLSLKMNLVDLVRFYGLFLQLLGAIVILIVLKQKLQLFKGHGLLKLLVNYFKRFPISIKPIFSNLGATMTGSSHVSADLRGVKRPEEDIKDVIRYFDEEIQYIHERIAKNKNENKLEIQNLKTSLETTKTSLEVKIKDTKNLIEEIAVSNPWLELLGVVSIFWGLILGTIPDYVVKLMF